jgi:phospholipid/cholesterol/gamma-HCH transport system substrate-binding protein
LLNEEGRPVVRDLRNTIQAAEESMANLNATISDARPGVQALTKQTIPEVGQLVRDLRATTESLRSVTERLDREGALSILNGQKLPDYEAKKK